MNTKKIIKPGFHGDHLGAIFGFDFDKIAVFAAEYLKKNNNYENEKDIGDKFKILQYKIGKNIYLKKILKKRGLILKSFEPVTLYPYFVSKINYIIEVKEMLEWDYEGGIEAQLVGGVVSKLGNGVGMFLIDYLENKEKYLKEKELKMFLGGLCYIVDEHQKLTEKESDSFTGYIPYKDKKDEYQFVGDIIKVEETMVLSKKGYIIKTKIAGYEKEEEQFVIELFVLEDNLRTTLEKGKKITGVFWMFGYIIGK